MAAMRYAQINDVCSSLRINPETADASVIAHLTRIENALADVFDGKIGTSFGVPPTPSVRVFRASPRCTIVLERPARLITGVTVDGEPAADWTPRFGRDGLVYGIERHTGVWPVSVSVEAVWASDSHDDVPLDVQEALTFLTIRQYRIETASPNEQVGPDGFQVFTPSGWDSELVKGAIANHRVVEVIV